MGVDATPKRATIENGRWIKAPVLRLEVILINTIERLEAQKIILQAAHDIRVQHNPKSFPPREDVLLYGELSRKLRIERFWQKMSSKQNWVTAFRKGGQYCPPFLCITY